MTAKPLSRRDFLKAAGITLGASTLACAGLGYAATLPPEIKTPELMLGKENGMNKRILVTYATRAGSTVEVAEAIGKTLSARGYGADVKPVKDKPRLDGYQAVLVGSAIRMGNWLPEAVDFLKSNQVALKGLPVALFTVHMLNTGAAADSRAKRLAYLDPVRPLVNAVDEVYFDGKMDFSRLSYLDRFISAMVKAVEADHRDWNKIRSWAEGLALAS
jgi:menaquinone-dependent protoporphyrinogen oxidase